MVVKNGWRGAWEGMWGVLRGLPLLFLLILLRLLLLSSPSHEIRVMMLRGNRGCANR
jgi:hypothetical protein